MHAGCEQRQAIEASLSASPAWRIRAATPSCRTSTAAAVRALFSDPVCSGAAADCAEALLAAPQAGAEASVFLQARSHACAVCGVCPHDGPRPSPLKDHQVQWQWQTARHESQNTRWFTMQ